jgi:hypothetical protein
MAQTFNGSIGRKGFDKDNPIELYGSKHTFVQQIPGKFACSPVLIIDDFNTDSKENKSVVTQVFTRASRSNIVVFILTKEEDWATKLVKLNGGMKIVPVHDNISNDRQIWEPFTQDPVWKPLEWEVTCLQDLVRLECEESGLVVEEVINEPMLPRSAMRLVKSKDVLS